MKILFQPLVLFLFSAGEASVTQESFSGRPRGGGQGPLCPILGTALRGVTAGHSAPNPALHTPGDNGSQERPLKSLKKKPKQT